jgi:hypothetical protein
MVFNDNFNNISVISRRSDLLVTTNWFRKNVAYQKKKDKILKGTNNDLQNTTQKTKD